MAVSHRIFGFSGFEKRRVAFVRCDVLLVIRLMSDSSPLRWVSLTAAIALYVC